MNLVIDWCGAKIYVPNAVHTTLVQDNLLASHVQSGIVIVLSNEKDLELMREETIQKKISTLKCPKFWRESEELANLRENYLKGRGNYDAEWEYIYNNDFQMCKIK